MGHTPSSERHSIVRRGLSRRPFFSQPQSSGIPIVLEADDTEIGAQQGGSAKHRDHPECESSGPEMVPPPLRCNLRRNPTSTPAKCEKRSLLPPPLRQRRTGVLRLRKSVTPRAGANNVTQRHRGHSLAARTALRFSDFRAEAQVLEPGSLALLGAGQTLQHIRGTNRPSMRNR